MKMYPTINQSAEFYSISISAVYQQRQEQEDDNPTMNPITRASWYAAEALGSIFGRVSSSKPIDDEPPRGLKYRPSLVPTSKKQQVNILIPPSTMDETLTRIQYDNDRCYFLSGQVDVLIYDPNCLFADPFVSFRGRDRFINNLKNLNTFITRYDAKLISLNSSKEGEEDSSSSFQVETKIMVKLELNLPWKPILAWPWGVTYQIDPVSNLVMVHRESWDIDPLEVWHFYFISYAFHMSVVFTIQ